MTQPNSNERNPISNGELLQANATVIAGVLIFLTISSLTPTSHIIGLQAGVAASVIIPFSISSVAIIGRKTKFGRWFSNIGFTFLGISLIFLAYFSIHPQYINPFQFIHTTAEDCAINPKKYNVTHVSDCSGFVPGSFAQDCVFDPEKYHVELKQCSNFIEQSKTN
jgi:hypothetical protein